MATYSSIYAGPPRWYGSTRTVKKYIAIHNTSNDATAEGEASYARRREDSVSSHYYVDNDSLLQSLDTALRAYHAGSSIGNSLAIAYEITGTNSKTRTWWLTNVAWALLAQQIATDCREFRIEPRLLTVAEIKAGQLTGIITHDQMRQAWGGTTHTDPGGNFPLDHLLGLVRAALGEDGDVSVDDVRIGLHGLLKEAAARSTPTGIQVANYLAAIINPLLKPLATGADLLPRLDAILAAAQDDGDTTVVLDPAALAVVQELRAAVTGVAEAVAALPEETADAVADVQAARLQE